MMVKIRSRRRSIFATHLGNAVGIQADVLVVPVLLSCRALPSSDTLLSEDT